MNRLTAWRRGVAQATPIVLGYVPIGFAYGALAQKAGLSITNTVLMSVFVFAGSAQLIAVGLVAAGATALTIILTTFIVNLRHLLFSIALSPYLKKWRKLELVFFAQEMTDETFALHSIRFGSGQQTPKAETFGINTTAQGSWILGSWLGAMAGQLITDVKPLALDYALPAMFIALLLLQIQNKLQVFIALLTGLLAIGLLLAGLDQWHVIAATLIGATIGMMIEQWTNKQSS